MAQPWEESLDLDDSDLSSLHHSKRQTTTTASPSQPFLRRCSQTLSSQNYESTQNLPSQLHPRLIPGPAGILQGAMIRRRNSRNRDNSDEHPIPTQEYIRRAVEDGLQDEDGDFTLSPWLSAVEFIRLQGFADSDGAIGIPLSVIKSRIDLDKVAQVVAIVKCCKPNGLGDLMVTLKDPTGTIDATIHRRVLNETEFGKDISFGAVVIAQKVAVFSPSRSAHYLNITRSNIVKVIPKDTSSSIKQNLQVISKNTSSSLKQNCSVPVVKLAAPVSEFNGNSWMPEKLFALSQGRTEGIMSSLRQTTRGSSCDEHMERNKATAHSCNNDVANGTKEGTDKSNNDEVGCEELDPSTQAGKGHKQDSARYSSTSADSVNVFNNQEIGKVSGTKRRQPLTSSVSLPQWTDEQLDELFALD